MAQLRLRSCYAVIVKLVVVLATIGGWYKAIVYTRTTAVAHLSLLI